MHGLVMAAQLILGLSILVILHEFGHFITARMFGIKVEKFYLFFDAWGFKLFSFKRGDTEYGVGWLPFGGYVKIAGMIDESLDVEAMKQPPQPWEFRSKPAWKRLIVMIGGVLVNAILGVIIFSFVLLHYEKKYLPNEAVTDGVYAYQLGRDVGFRTGDKVVSINGRKVNRFKDIYSTSVLLGSKILVNRHDSLVQIVIPGDFYKKIAKAKRGMMVEAMNFPFRIDSVVPGMNAAKAGVLKGDVFLRIGDIPIQSWGQFSEEIRNFRGRSFDALVERNLDTLTIKLDVDTSGLIGVVRSQMPYPLKDYTVGSALHYGWKDAIDIMVANVKGFGKILSGKENASESIQGPIGIARIYGAVWDWSRFWFITGLLSLILAFMNILPIPALDGGHVIFLSIEAITGKRFSDKFMERAQIAGMIILLALMVFAVGNDIFKLFR